jgi:hypothetical protein
MVLAPRRFAVAVAALLVGVGSLALPALSSASSAVQPARAASHASGGGRVFTGYAINEPVCPVVTKPGEFTCMAMRKVDVAKGTPGAYRYTIPRAARGPAGGYTPNALAKAYSFNAKSGKGETVAIVDWNDDPSVRSDLNHFDKHYGLPKETSKSFRVVNQNGKAHPLPSPDQHASVEIALDVEAVRGVCQKCKIILVEAKAGLSTDLAKAENTAARFGVDVISNSFGSPEVKGHPYPSSIVKAFNNHPGIVTTVSSGDDGFYYWDLRNADPFGTNLPHQASFPSTLPNVVAVGGTSLRVNPNGTRKSESVWDTNGASDAEGNTQNRPLGAAGGGCSVLFKAPSWQKHMAGYKQAGCKGKRLAVDVSAVGDPSTGYSVYDSFGLNGWAVIGGTSLSSPVIAAMFALSGGKPRDTTPGHALYQNKNLRPKALYDVKTGGNGWCGGASLKACSAQARTLGAGNPNRLYAAKVDCSYPIGHGKMPKHKDPECNAQAGYDGPTGVGTPNGLAPMNTTLPGVDFTITTPRRAHHKLKFNASIKRVLDSSKIKAKKWSFGDHSSSKQGGTVHHTYRKSGHYTVKLTVKDNRGQHVVASKRIHVK